jgi:ferredoxin
VPIAPREKEKQVAKPNTQLTERRAAATPLRVVVNLNRCQGYAQCCFFAPDVFWLHGEEALWYDLAPDESQREQVRRAAAACPVQAILLGWPEEPDCDEAQEADG